ncbi:MAG: type II toxin-antitoxin system RelE/ParE family toxin [Xanthobacteraceae bacterium]
MKLEWSAAALADLDRFAAFLQERHPTLASIVAREILSKAQMLEAHPQLGYPIGGGGEYRQVVLEVLRAKYVFRYRVASERIVMMRVYHGREKRE